MTTDQKIIANKVGLLKLAQTLGSVSQACRVMGYSRLKKMTPVSKKVCEKPSYPGLSRCSMRLIMAMWIIASLLSGRSS